MSREESSTTQGASRTRLDRASGGVEKPAADQSPPPRAELDDRLYTHLLTILSVSSGMVGVCLTAIGLIGIMKSLSKIEMLADDVLALSTLAFTIATALSFFGMRTRLSLVWRGFATTLDAIFCIGLILVVLATVLLTRVVLSGEKEEARQHPSPASFTASPLPYLPSLLGLGAVERHCYVAL